MGHRERRRVVTITPWEGWVNARQDKTRQRQSMFRAVKHHRHHTWVMSRHPALARGASGGCRRPGGSSSRSGPSALPCRAIRCPLRRRTGRAVHSGWDVRPAGDDRPSGVCQRCSSTIAFVRCRVATGPGAASCTWRESRGRRGAGQSQRWQTEAQTCCWAAIGTKVTRVPAYSGCSHRPKPFSEVQEHDR